MILFEGALGWFGIESRVWRNFDAFTLPRICRELIWKTAIFGNVGGKVPGGGVEGGVKLKWSSLSSIQSIDQ